VRYQPGIGIADLDRIGALRYETDPDEFGTGGF